MNHLLMDYMYFEENVPNKVSNSIFRYQPAFHMVLDTVKDCKKVREQF